MRPFQGQDIGSIPLWRTMKTKKNFKSDVHTTHCCAKHGCKYGDKDCTVVLHPERQELDQCEAGWVYEESCFDEDDIEYHI